MFVLLYNFLFTCNTFCFFCLKKIGIFFLEKKNCVDFNCISLIHSHVYLHIALCYKELYFKDSCNNLAMPHSV